MLLIACNENSPENNAPKADVKFQTEVADFLASSKDVCLPKFEDFPFDLNIEDDRHISILVSSPGAFKYNKVEMDSLVKAGLLNSAKAEAKSKIGGMVKVVRYSLTDLGKTFLKLDYDIKRLCFAERKLAAVTAHEMITDRKVNISYNFSLINIADWAKHSSLSAIVLPTDKLSLNDYVASSIAKNRTIKMKLKSKGWKASKVELFD